MWSLRNLVLFVLIIGTFDIVRCNRLALVVGYGVENPSKEIRVELNSRLSLKDDEQCRSMKKISSVLGLINVHSGFVSDLPNLEKITFHLVSKIEPGAFRNVPKLSKVEFFGSQFRTIKEGIFNNLNIVELSFALCSLGTIAPAAFDDMPKLEKLSLRSNSIASWNSEWLKNTPNLKSLSLFQNDLGELPSEAFKNLKNPEIDIDLSFNHIKKMERKLFSTKKIGRLSVKHNHMDSFGEHVLDGVEGMQDLNISYNDLNCFSGNLSRIFVANNTFLMRNDFDCECVKKILEWEKKTGKENHVHYILVSDCRFF